MCHISKEQKKKLNVCVFFFALFKTFNLSHSCLLSASPYFGEGVDGASGAESGVFFFMGAGGDGWRGVGE